MNDPKRFQITSAGHAEEALEYFNAFHDGFIRRIAIDSHDRIEGDGSQTCTGLYEVEVIFGPYNYPAGQLQPFDREVAATFREAQDIRLDLASAYLGSPIIQLSVEAAERTLGGTTTSEPALALLLGRHLYIEPEQRFEYREHRLFTFRSADFVEA